MVSNDADISPTGHRRLDQRDPGGGAAVERGIIDAENAMTTEEAMQIALQHHQAGRLAEAEKIYRQVLAQIPDHAGALHLLSVLAQKVGRRDLAVELITRAIAVDPTVAEAFSNLGAYLTEPGRLDEAIAACRRAIELKPDFAEAYYNLGNALQATGRLDEAITAYGQAIQLKPALAEAQYNLGILLQSKGRLDEAIAAFRRVIQLKPDYAEAHNGLGNAFKDMGRLEAAIASYRQAVALNPQSASLHSNLVYMLYFSEDDPVAISAELQRWADRHAAPLAGKIRPHDNDRTPDRRLRIGYISPDFRDHIIGRLAEPILANHDRGQFEVFCYSNVSRPDAVTRRLQRHPATWRNIVGVSDDQAAQMIRQDGVDILVDLTTHMAHNRMLVMARKPAPVQVTHLTYPAPAGLSTIDYRITDPYFDPPDCNSFGPEIPILLPHFVWCYQPDSDDPAVNALPALSAKHIVFGSLNNLCKVSPGAIALWSRVLHAVANSRMIVLTPGDPGAQTYLLEQFAGHGVAANRLELVGRHVRKEYLAIYHQIDIGLDPLPYTGHTTSCDSFWMGVPVVTLPGRTTVSRGGTSLATNLGLKELIARTPEEYVKIAAELAGDLPRLSKLRGELRQRMKDSPLMDEAGYTRDLENAYRTMWHRWLQNP